MAAERVGRIGKVEELNIMTRTGIAHDVQTRTDHVTTSRTTAYGGGGNRYRIDPIDITTDVETKTRHKTRLFIVEQDGTEIDLDLPDPGFGVRVGHALTVVLAGDKASERGHPMALVNLNTGNSRVFGERARWIVKPIPWWQVVVAAIVVPFVCMFIATVVTGTGGAEPAGIGLAIVAVFAFYLYSQRASLLKAVVDQVTDRAAREAARG